MSNYNNRSQHPAASQAVYQPSHASQPSFSTPESATSRFKRAFGRRKTGRLTDEDGTQSDAPSPSRRLGPAGGIPSLIAKKDPMPALQFASSTFQALGQRLNKPTSGPRVVSQIGPPPDFILPAIPDVSKLDDQRVRSPSPPNGTSQAMAVPVNPKTIHRTSQLVAGPEISAAIEYMLDSPRNSASSPPRKRISLEPSKPTEPNPSSPRAARSGSVSADTAPQPRPSRDGSDPSKRRSMSLSFIPGLSSTAQAQAQVQPTTIERDVSPPSSYNSPKFVPSSFTPHHRSQSTVHNLPTLVSSSSLSEAQPTVETNANGFIMPSHSDRSSSNIRGKLAAWTSSNGNLRARGDGGRGSSPNHSKAASMVASIGPAATAATGIAVNLSKRAYDKVNSMWAVNNRGAHSHSAPHSAQTSESDSSRHPQRYPASIGIHGRTRANLGSGAGSMSDAETTRRRLGIHMSSSHQRSDAGMHSISPISDLPVGPSLGTMLRPPFRRINQGGGLVFGRPLADCVRDTKPLVVVGNHLRGDEGDSDDDENHEGGIVAIESRYIPALVLRCVQHIERWGLIEEGVFRIAGRTSHINKLRMEFASGADYDLQECGPSDLDPHAVASVLKAFVRELPEPILTRMRVPSFDAAFERAKNAGFMLAMPSPTSPPPPGGYSAGARHGGIGGLPSNPRVGLPSNPRDALTPPPQTPQDFLHLQPSPSSQPSAPRSPPATPDPSKSFDPATPDAPASATPAEALETLLQEFRMLTLSLPRENRDLLLTIVELLRKAAAESKVTKMPLSNLLLVLCPSMNMNPGVLKVFVEHSSVIFEEKSLPSPNPTPTTAPPPTSARAIVGPYQDPEPTESKPVSQVHTPVTPEVYRPTDPRQSVEVVTQDQLPVRKQSLRRGQQQVRVTSGEAPPSAYVAEATLQQEDGSKEPVVEPIRPVEFTEPLRYAIQLQGDIQRKQGLTRSNSSSSRSTSPSASQEGLRPVAPVGPRPPRNIPAPLNLHGHKSSISSTQSFTPQQKDFPRTPPVTQAVSPRIVAFPPTEDVEHTIDATSPAVELNLPQSESTSQSGEGVTLLLTPSLPEVENAEPMTSTFVDKRVTHMLQRRTIFASDITPPHSGSTGPAMSPPAPNTGVSLPPLPDTGTSIGTAATHGSSLGVPTPSSQNSIVSQPLTPLLMAMQRENAEHEATEGRAEDEEIVYPRVEPLTLQKKATTASGMMQSPGVTSLANSDSPTQVNPSGQALRLDKPSGIYSDSTLSSASSVITDSATSYRELSWPEVPTTIPVLKPGINISPLPIQSTPSGSSPDPGMSRSAPPSAWNAIPISNSYYPPQSYPSSLHAQNPSTSTPKETVSTTLPEPDSAGWEEEPALDGGLLDLTRRGHSNAETRAPRLTVNSKELLSGDSFWARELQKAIQSASPTSPVDRSHGHEHDATRYSGEWAASVLNAAGT